MYCLVRGVRTNPIGYWYADCSLLGSTAEIGRRLSIEGERRRGRRRKGREEGDTCCSPVPHAIRRPQAILSRWASFSPRGEMRRERRRERGGASSPYAGRRENEAPRGNEAIPRLPTRGEGRTR
ncbi:hypothetical protein GW17_00025604 [Ensete ventricosum]|nr:hypothetical protein GW17_00025604 [Ensete ventricosum]